MATQRLPRNASLPNADPYGYLNTAVLHVKTSAAVQSAWPTIVKEQIDGFCKCVVGVWSGRERWCVIWRSEGLRIQGWLWGRLGVCGGGGSDAGGCGCGAVMGTGAGTFVGTGVDSSVGGGIS